MREKFLKATIILIMISFMFSSSCDIFEPSDPGELIEEFIVDIEFSDIENNEVNFSLETVFYYGCLFYEIKFDCLLKDNAIKINILDIIEPEMCLTAFAPAEGNEVKKVPFGEYLLIIRYLNFLDIYILNIEKDNIKLTPIKQTFTRINQE